MSETVLCLVYGAYEVLRAFYDRFTGKTTHGLAYDIFDMSKISYYFSGHPRLSASCVELIKDTGDVFTDDCV